MSEVIRAADGLEFILQSMYIYLEDYGYSHRINAAYYAGGCEYLEKCIEDYFGFEVNRYARVRFREFATVVDAVGGVDINISDDEADWINAFGKMQSKVFYGEDVSYTKIPSGGYRHLDGNQALAYSRIRYLGNADWERTQRQRRVIRDIISKTKNLNLLQMDNILNEVLPHVRTDLTNSEIASLLLHAYEYRGYTVQEVRIPADGYFTNEVIDGMAVLVFDPEANAAIIQKVVYGDCANEAEAIAEYEKENGKLDSKD